MAGKFGIGQIVSVDLALNQIDTNSNDYDNFVAAIYDAVAAYAGPRLLSFDGIALTFTSLADGDTMSDLIIDLPVTDDVYIEGPGDFQIELLNANSASGSRYIRVSDL